MNSIIGVPAVTKWCLISLERKVNYYSYLLPMFQIQITCVM